MGLLSLVAKLMLDGSNFETGIKRMEGTTTKFGRTLEHEIKGKLAAAFSTVALEEGIRRTVEWGSKIEDLSKRLGVSTDFLQEMEFAARQSGATLEDFVGVLQKIAVARDEALGGGEKGKSMTATFARLGVNAQQLKSARLEDILGAISRRFKESGDAQALMADGIQVMGRASPGVFATLIEGLEESAAEARRLGLVLESDVIRRLDTIGDRAAIVATRTRGIFANIAFFLLSTVVSVRESLLMMADLIEMVGKRVALLAKRAAGRIDAAQFQKEFDEAGAEVGRREKARIEGMADFLFPAAKPPPPNVFAPEPREAPAEKEERTRTTRTHRESVDALQRIGGFRGTPPPHPQVQRIMQRQQTDISAIRAEVARMNSLLLRTLSD
jgi:hypothetical protein